MTATSIVFDLTTPVIQLMSRHVRECAWSNSWTSGQRGASGFIQILDAGTHSDADYSPLRSDLAEAQFEVVSTVWGEAITVPGRSDAVVSGNQDAGTLSATWVLTYRNALAGAARTSYEEVRYLTADVDVIESMHGQSVSESLGAVEMEVDDVFAGARDEDFEQGMQSVFAQRLESLVLGYGDLAMSEVSHLILSKESVPAVVAEALRALSGIAPEVSFRWRSWVMRHCLVNGATTHVRDAAALALAELEGCDALPFLRSAADCEVSRRLKKRILQLCDWLGRECDDVASS